MLCLRPPWGPLPRPATRSASPPPCFAPPRQGAPGCALRRSAPPARALTSSRPMTPLPLPWGGWPTREVLIFSLSPTRLGCPIHDTFHRHGWGTGGVQRGTTRAGAPSPQILAGPSTRSSLRVSGEPPTAGRAGNRPRRKPLLVTLYVKRKRLPLLNSFRIKYGLPRGRGEGVPREGDSPVKSLSFFSLTTAPWVPRP